MRADSAYYGFSTVDAALRAGADVSIAAREDRAVKRAIATIPGDAWTPIENIDPLFDDSTGTWISKAEVAEIPLTVFTSRAKKDHLAVIAFNLRRAAGTITGTALAKATTSTIRRKLIAPGQDRILRPSYPTTPAPGVALGHRVVGALRPRPAITAKLIRRPTSHPGESRNQQWNTTGRKAHSSTAPTTTRLFNGSRAHPHPTTSVDRGLRLRRSHFSGAPRTGEDLDWAVPVVLGAMLESAIAALSPGPSPSV